MSVIEPEDHHVFVSLDCVVENLALAATAHDRSGLAAFVGAKEDREHWVQVLRECQRFAL